MNTIDYTAMTKAQLAAELKDAGIAFSAKATKQDMINLLSPETKLDLTPTDEPTATPTVEELLAEVKHLKATVTGHEQIIADLEAKLAKKTTRKPAAPRADKAEVFAAQRAKVVASLAEVAGAEVTTEWTDKSAYTTAKMTLDGKTVSIYVQPNSSNFRPTGLKGEERGKFVAKLAKALKGHTAEAKVRDAGRDSAYVQITF